ncbi:MAG: magnesium transporter [bacterium]|nr:magnesium transporter [bacterium]
MDAIRTLLKRVPLFSPDTKAGDALQEIQKKKKWDTLNYVYLISESKQLKGIVSMKELIATPRNVRLSKVAKKPVISVHENSKLEQIAILAVQHNIKSLPVVDSMGVFIGVVGTDDIMRTLQHARIYDGIRYSGVHLDHHSFLNVSRGKVLFLVKRRLPWLLFGLGGALLSALLVEQFELVLQRVIELAFFTPAVVYMGDALGTQTQALFLRSITIGNVRVSKFIMKELLIDSVIGLCVGALSFGYASLILHDSLVPIVVGIAMFCTLATSGIVAILITVFLSKQKKDPALGSGPFATIVQDLVSIAIYFLVASAVLGF